MGWMFDEGRETISAGLEGDAGFALVEPAPAQRKDSVLRRDMKGSALTLCSVTHAHKLIHILEPLNSLRLTQTRPAAISLPFRLHPARLCRISIAWE